MSFFLQKAKVGMDNFKTITNLPQIIQYIFVKKNNNEEWKEASISGNGRSILYTLKKLK